ncbi:copper resistance CopC family protein [Dactylosporangium sp. CA-139066]|uniref:copper resistance CopC family protein n=1 Tax=Dactylosporangium sp. CA-139066 TaxID=3239930 RepID=UPI003D8BD820
MLPVLAGAVLALAPAPAIVDSVPPGGAALSTPPAVVELIGSRPVDAAASHVAVSDAAGRAVNAGPPAADGTRLRVAVRIAGAGDYTIAYHVVFSGGGETIGTRTFSVGTGARPRGAVPAPPVHAAHEHGVDPLGGSLLLADLAVALGAGVLLLRRPRPTRK